MTDRTGVEGLLRRLAPQALGAVVRRYGHFADAEDAVQEALVAAAASWPADGVPDSPLGWLVRVASRRMADLYRSDEARRRREDVAASWSREPPDPALGTRRHPGPVLHVLPPLAGAVVGRRAHAARPRAG